MTAPAAAPWRAQSGFSLIEVMIAIMIMAMLSLIAWRGLDSMSRANTQLQMRTEETARLMRALQQFERDLAWRATVELPAVAAEAAGPQGDDAEAEATPRARRAAAPVPLLPAGMDVRQTDQSPLSIELVRAAPAAPGRWQRVRWWLQGGTLYRAAGEAAESYPLPAPRADDRIAALAGVASFSIRAWEPGRGWRPLPAGSTARAPAAGLEITLGIRRTAGPVLQYRHVAAFD